MPNTDLTGTTWILNNDQLLELNAAFDVSFATENQSYNLLQVSGDSIHYDNYLAYGEEKDYTNVISNLSLTEDTVCSYRINGGTVDAQGHSITGDIILENGGTLRNVSSVNGKIQLSSGVIEDCSILGAVALLGSCTIINSEFKSRINIINVQNASVSFDNCAINPAANCAGGLNIINSSVTMTNLAINLNSSSAALYNKLIVKGNSQVTLNNCSINCANIAATVTNFIVEDSAELTIAGDNTSLNAVDVSTNILHTSSNNIIMTGGTYSFNPSNYNFITIQTGYEVREIQYGNITLYRVVRQAINYDIL